MKYRNLVIFVMIITLLVLPACTRRASTPPPTAEESGIGLEVTVAPTEPVQKEVSPTKPPAPKPTATEAPASPTAEPPAAAYTVATAEMAAPVDSEPHVTASAPAFEVFSGYGDGTPTFGVRGVVYNESVTIQANDFPANETYTVFLARGDYSGTGWIEAGTGETGEGGTFLATFDIPESLLYVGTIAAKIEFADGTATTNWFYNVTTY